MKLMRLSPRFTGDRTHRTCRGCWRDLPADEFYVKKCGPYLTSRCRECLRPLAARNARKRYAERGEAWRRARIAQISEARRRRRARTQAAAA